MKPDKNSRFFKIGTAIGYGVALVVGACLLAILVALTVKLITWMF